MKKADNIKKLKYLSPVIETIEIDKNISLQLDSSPPVGPSETNNTQPNEIANPFKTKLV